MECAPDFQQHAVTIRPPLTIPESQFLDAIRCEKLFSFVIASALHRQAVLKAIQLDRQLCDGTIKIQKVNSSRMLARKFESGETACPQCAPQLLFLIGLDSTKATSIDGAVHYADLLSPALSSIRWRRGRKHRRALWKLPVIVQRRANNTRHFLRHSIGSLRSSRCNFALWFLSDDAKQSANNRMAWLLQSEFL